MFFIPLAAVMKRLTMNCPRLAKNVIHCLFQKMFKYGDFEFDWLFENMRSRL